jgi:ankyrin repeat protein
MNPLVKAAFNGDLISVEKLLNDDTVNYQTPADLGLTALMAASDQGSKDRVNFSHTKIVDLLLKRGADAKLHCVEGFNALMFAAADGSLDIVKLLVEHDKTLVNTTFKNDKVCVSSAGRLTTHKFAGWTPIMFASYEGHPDIVEYLRESGASPVDTNQLYHCIRSNYLDGVKVCWELAASAGGEKQWCTVSLAWSALVSAKSEEIFEFFYAKLDDSQRKEFADMFLKSTNFSEDLCPWLVKRGLFSPGQLLSVLDHRKRKYDIATSKILEWSALVKAFYEWRFSSSVDSEVTVILCHSEDKSYPVQDDRIQLVTAGDKDLRSQTQVNFPSPNAFIKNETLKEYARDYSTVKEWIKIDDTKVSSVLKFLEEYTAGGYFLDIFFEDLGASGLGGYRINEYECYVQKGGSIVYCNKYHVDRSYGTSLHFVNSFTTMSDLILDLKEEHAFQRKLYGEYVKEDVFYGDFLLQIQGDNEMKNIEKLKEIF